MLPLPVVDPVPLVVPLPIPVVPPALPDALPVSVLPDAVPVPELAPVPPEVLPLLPMPLVPPLPALLLELLPPLAGPVLLEPYPVPPLVAPEFVRPASFESCRPHAVTDNASATPIAIAVCFFIARILIVTCINQFGLSQIDPNRRTQLACPPATERGRTTAGAASQNGSRPPASRPLSCLLA